MPDLRKKPQILCFIGYPSIFSTDTCLHVGAVLAHCVRRVLLIDMKDNRGLRSQSLSDWFPPVESGVYDALIGMEPEILYGDGERKWDFLPDCGGDTDEDIALNMNLALQALKRRNPSPELLRDVLAPIGNNYDDILIDCGDLYSFSPFIEEMALTADSNFIMTLFAGQKDIEKDFRTFLEVRPKAFQQEQLRAVVFAAYEETSAQQTQCLYVCREYLPDDIPVATIGQSEDIEGAFQCHKDIIAFAPESRSAAEYAMLARTLLGGTYDSDFLHQYEQIMRKYTVSQSRLQRLKKKIRDLIR